MAKKQTKSANGFLTAMVVLLVLACVAVGVLGYYSEGFQNWEKFQKAETSEEVKTDDSLGFDIQNSANVILTMGVATTAGDEKTISKTLTATVLPEDAPDKSVDWSVEWVIPVSEDAIVTDYVTVTPESDGSNVATVTCHKGFEGGTIHVVCTTRVGGFQAYCRVNYEGAPEKFEVVYQGENIRGQELEVQSGKDYSLQLQLSNTLESVGSKYGEYEITDIRMHGRFNARKDYIVNGSVQKSEEFVIDLANPTFKIYGSGGSEDGETITISASEFATISLSGETISIHGIKNEHSYTFPSVYPRTGTRVVFVSEFTDPRGGGTPDDCRIILEVKEKVSGLTALVFIDVISTVTSITVDNCEIIF